MDIMNLIWDRIAQTVKQTGLVEASESEIRERVVATIPSIVAFLSMTEIFLVPLEQEYAGMSNQSLAGLLEKIGGVEISGADQITEEHRASGYSLLRDLIEVYKIFKIKI